MNEPGSGGKAGIRPVLALVALPGSAGAARVGAATAAVPLIRSTTARSDEILGACQSTWWAPPEYHPGWNEDALVRELAVLQVGSVEAELEASGSGGALWFDERHPLLLELWQPEATWLTGAVLVWGTPQQAQDELRVEGIGPVHATALWELAAQRALLAVAGRRVFICSTASLSDGDGRTAASLSAFLAETGVGVGAGVVGATSVTGLTEPRSEMDNDEQENKETPFLQLLSSLTGAHQSLDVVPPGLSDTTTELLSAHRQAYRLGLEARTAWSLAERRQRENMAVRADLSRTMAGADLMVSHLLNSL